MKKKSIIAICAVLVILVLAAVLVLTGNRGNVSNVNRVVGYSALYGENSINEAFDVIEKKFAKDFEGCTLTELRYDKDVENRFAEEIEKYHKENNQELIVVLSTFNTDEKGGDGSFNSNDTYDNWQWYLVNAIVIFLPLSPYFPSFLMYIKRVFSLFALLISNDMPFCRTTFS